MEFHLRKFTTADAPALSKYANNRKIADRLTDQFPHPYTLEHALNFIKNVANSPHNLVFTISINGEACGGIGLHPKTDVDRLNAELGYWLAEPYWGKGIVTNAIQQIVEIGFNKLPIQRIFARPYGSNEASKHVLEKAGFKLEGKFDKTLIKNNILEDEYIYAIRKNG